MNTEKFGEIQQRCDHLFNGLTAADIAEWRHNPCTQWLLTTLESEMILMFISWYNGAFQKEDSPLSPEQAQGKSQAIDDVYEKVQEMLQRDEG